MDLLDPSSWFTTEESLDSPSARDQLRQHIFGGTEGLDNQAFLDDLYGEERLDPHEEMERAEQIYRSNTYVVKGVDTMTNALLGRRTTVERREQESNADADEEGIKALRRHFNRRLKPELREAVENAVKTGNGYITVKKEGGVYEYSAIPRSEDVYIEYDDDFNVDYYVVEVPDNITDRRDQYTSFSVGYGRNQEKQVKGFRLETNEIIHLRIGTSHIPVYGRSSLASASDDIKILRELERDQAVISRYKSVPRKILELEDIDGQRVPDNKLAELKRKLQNMQDYENLYTNKPINVEDMSYAGEVPNLQPMIQYFTEKIVSGLAPSFYMFGKETTYAVSNDQKNMYLLRIQSIRDGFKEPINEHLRKVARDQDVESTGITVEFGEFDFPTEKETAEKAKEQFRAGLITLNEARDKLGLGQADDDIGDLYRFEIEQNAPDTGQGSGGAPQGPLSGLLDQ